VDGYSGRAAWDYLKQHKPNQERFATDSPKWALLPVDAPVTFASSSATPQINVAAKSPAQEAQEIKPQQSPPAVPASLDAPAAETSPIFVQAAVAKITAVPAWYQIPNTKLSSVCPSTLRNMRLARCKM
jgi:hypothetical protein